MSEIKKINISQSLLKDLNEYVKGYKCGQELHYEQDFKDDPDRQRDSEAQHLGNYFEYHATGAKPRDGQIPMPRRVKTKVAGSELTELSADYARVKEQAKKFNKYMADLGFEVAKDDTGKPLRGVVYEYMHEGIGRKIKVVIDLIVKATKDVVVMPYHYNTDSGERLEIKAGEFIIVDLKCTGLLMDKYDHYGWHPDTLPERPGHWLQPLFYKWVLKRLLPKIDFHFMWAVASNKPDMGLNFMYPNFEPELFDTFEQQYIISANPLITKLENRELKPKPRYVRCRDCRFNDICQFAALKPEIWIIDIAG